MKKNLVGKTIGTVAIMIAAQTVYDVQASRYHQRSGDVKSLISSGTVADLMTLGASQEMSGDKKLRDLLLASKIRVGQPEDIARCICELMRHMLRQSDPLIASKWTELYKCQPEAGRPNVTWLIQAALQIVCKQRPNKFAQLIGYIYKQIREEPADRADATAQWSEVLKRAITGITKDLAPDALKALAGTLLKDGVRQMREDGALRNLADCIRICGLDATKQAAGEERDDVSGVLQDDGAFLRTFLTTLGDTTSFEEIVAVAASLNGGWIALGEEVSRKVQARTATALRDAGWRPEIPAILDWIEKPQKYWGAISVGEMRAVLKIVQGDQIWDLVMEAAGAVMMEKATQVLLECVRREDPKEAATAMVATMLAGKLTPNIMANATPTCWAYIWDVCRERGLAEERIRAGILEYAQNARLTGCAKEAPTLTKVWLQAPLAPWYDACPEAEKSRADRSVLIEDMRRAANVMTEEEARSIEQAVAKSDVAALMLLIGYNPDVQQVMLAKASELVNPKIPLMIASMIDASGTWGKRLGEANLTATVIALMAQQLRDGDVEAWREWTADMLVRRAKSDDKSWSPVLKVAIARAFRGEDELMMSKLDPAAGKWVLTVLRDPENKVQIGYWMPTALETIKYVAEREQGRIEMSFCDYLSSEECESIRKAIPDPGGERLRSFWEQVDVLTTLLAEQRDQPSDELSSAIMAMNLIAHELQRRYQAERKREMGTPRTDVIEGDIDMWRAIEMITRGSTANPDIPPGKFGLTQQDDVLKRFIEIEAHSAPMTYARKAKTQVALWVQKQNPELMGMALRAGIDPTRLTPGKAEVVAKTSGGLLEAVVLQMLDHNMGAPTKTVYAQFRCSSPHEQEAVDYVVRRANEAGIEVLLLDESEDGSQIQLAYKNPNGLSFMRHARELVPQMMPGSWEPTTVGRPEDQRFEAALRMMWEDGRIESTSDIKNVLADVIAIHGVTGGIPVPEVAMSVIGMAVVETAAIAQQLSIPITDEFVELAKQAGIGIDVNDELGTVLQLAKADGGQQLMKLIEEDVTPRISDGELQAYRYALGMYQLSKMQWDGGITE
ncbi:MAG: hypothetical protein LBR78_00040 [Holosporales bacterium]|jgi:hypothetical protein|nr:hypothetical protein [Holosporales bacterium]